MWKSPRRSGDFQQIGVYPGLYNIQIGHPFVIGTGSEKKTVWINGCS
jgi:hypothetical protein